MNLLTVLDTTIQTKGNQMMIKILDKLVILLAVFASIFLFIALITGVVFAFKGDTHAAEYCATSFVYSLICAVTWFLIQVMFEENQP